MEQKKVEVIKHEIMSALAGEGSVERLSLFFGEMLTESEMANIAMRWELMKRLMTGHSQRNIAEDLSLSLCKITRGSKILKNDDSVVKSYLSATLTNQSADASEAGL